VVGWDTRASSGEGLHFCVCYLILVIGKGSVWMGRIKWFGSSWES
jgi:hypothetical protein